MYATGLSRATPALSSTEYAAIVSPVSTGHRIARPGHDAAAPAGSTCRLTMPTTTRATPAAPSADRRSSNTRNATMGTSATPRPRATG